jgi:hypothetical protein
MVVWVGLRQPCAEPRTRANGQVRLRHLHEAIRRCALPELPLVIEPVRDIGLDYIALRHINV